jgi:hypothetical protein
MALYVKAGIGISYLQHPACTAMSIAVGQWLVNAYVSIASYPHQFIGACGIRCVACKKNVALKWVGYLIPKGKFIDTEAEKVVLIVARLIQYHYSIINVVIELQSSIGGGGTYPYILGICPKKTSP